MFVLSIVKDKIPIHPSQFGLPPEQALIHELNKKYANRVLHDVGLCICVFDVAEAGEGKVRYGDGFLWYTGESNRLFFAQDKCPTFGHIVVFRLTVFRPFSSEVLLAKVKSSDEDGIQRA
jgi:DNA-directed RNA polymerase III subunit RPC8